MTTIFIYALAFLYGLFMYQVIITVLKWLRKWELKNHFTVEILPSEEDLRKRDEQERKAFIKYATRRNS